MDRKNVVLKDARPGQQTGVGDQVNAHIGTHRDQTAKRVQATNEKFVAVKKRQGGAVGSHTSVGNDCWIKPVENPRPVYYLIE
jgi:hypothetical protein